MAIVDISWSKMKPNIGLHEISKQMAAFQRAVPMNVAKHIKVY